MTFKVTVALGFLLNCTSCAYYVASEAVEVCDQSNVYCGEDEQEERVFKSARKDDALARDIENTVNAVGYVVDALSKESKEPIPHYEPESCEGDTNMICSTVRGCYCE